MNWYIWEKLEVHKSEGAFFSSLWNSRVLIAIYSRCMQSIGVPGHENRANYRRGEAIAKKKKYQRTSKMNNHGLNPM